MPGPREQIVEELRQVLHQAHEALEGDASRDDVDSLLSMRPKTGPDSSAQAITLCRSAIERFTPPDSPYRRQVEVFAKKRSVSDLGIARDMLGALEALILDYEADRLLSFEELVHADLSGDLLEQSESLLVAGYKDPSAVIAGAVLEQHLRLLAARYDVSVFSGGRPKKASQLNSDLKKAGAYSKTEEKEVTALLGRRNDAAHGEFESYTAEDVGRMINAIRGFLVRHPA